MMHLPSCRRWENRAGAFLLFALTVPLAGCPRNETSPLPPPASDSGQPIRLLVVDDAALATAIDTAWRSRSEAPLEVRKGSAAELKDALRLNADAVIYPSGLLGDLAERELLSPLAAEMQASDELRQHEVFDMLRLREVRWGEKTYAVSFGSPVFLLAYREDLLQPLDLKPPATWEEYHRTAAQLKEFSSGAENAPPSATVEPWGPGWAGLTFLARAAPYVRHRDQYSDLFDFKSMEPLIDSPAFERALKEMIAIRDTAALESTAYSPHDAYQEIAAGRAAMAIGWPPPRATHSNSTDVDDLEPKNQSNGTLVRWAELPGSPQVYHDSEGEWEDRQKDEPQRIPLLAAAGRLGSVTRETSRSKAALHVLAILSAAQSREVAAASNAAALYRQSHLSAPSDWYPAADDEEASSYAGAAQQSLSRGVWMFAPRLPGRSRYLAALDDAVRKALQGETSAESALAEAAQEWETITTELGRDRQRSAYRRSLGLEP